MIISHLPLSNQRKEKTIGKLDWTLNIIMVEYFIVVKTKQTELKALYFFKTEGKRYIFAHVFKLLIC